MSPTLRQQDALRFIRGYQLAHGHSPTLDEICVGTGALAKSGVHYKLAALEERGLIRRVPAKPRAIEVLDAIAIPYSPDGEPLYFIRCPA